MNEEELKHLNKLIKTNERFAIWRMPNEATLCFVHQQNPEAYCCERIEQLNNVKGFVVAPFSPSKEHPIVVIRSECGIQQTALASNTDKENHPTDKKQADSKNNNIPKCNAAYHMSQTSTNENATLDMEYRTNFSIFSKALQAEQLQKLVLSRSKEKALSADFSPAHAFIEAVYRYPYSYVYLCHTPETGTWMGSTPETLLSGKGKHWHTVSLAATLPNSKEGENTWDAHHKLEQQLVTDYIQTQLLSFGATHIHVEDPFTVQAAQLLHLRSNFHFELPNTRQIGSLLQHLHPTPAVSGLPKAEAFSFILQHETAKRAYYAGFIGSLDPDEQTAIYVNLRCMQIREKRATLYAGGGLLSSSVLETEWNETEYKMKTMESLISLL